MARIRTGRALVHAMGSALAAACHAGRASGPGSGTFAPRRFGAAFAPARIWRRPLGDMARRCRLAVLLLLPMLFPPATADAAGPDITFGTAAHSKAEDNSAGDLAIVVSANAAVSAPLTVSYTLGGTATPGTDYTIGAGANYAAQTGSFTIPSGTSAGIFVDAFTITAVSDALADSGETIIVTLVDGAGYDPGVTRTTTITLYENTGDAAFRIAGAPVKGETLTVARTVDDPDGNGTVEQYQWLRKSPDAEAWTRITGATASDYTLPLLVVGQELLVAVTYVDDLGVTRTVHTQPVGPVVEYYTVTFSAATYSAREGIPVHAWVHISPVRASPTYVPVTTTALTATGGGVDYQDTNTTVAIPADWDRFPLSVDTVIDKVLDEGETFRLDIDASGLPDGVRVGAHGSAVVTLLDPVLEITGGDAVDEGQPAVFTVNMDFGPGGVWPYVDVRVAVPWGGRVYNRTVRRDKQKTTLSFKATSDDLNVRGDWHYCAWVLPVTGYKVGNSAKPPKPDAKTYDGNPANCPSGATVLVRDDDDDPSESEAPRITSIERQYPSSAKAITPAYLRWRVTFSEVVESVDKGDFEFTGTTAGLSVRQSKDYYGWPIDTTWDITARGGDLLDIKGTVTLSLADDQNIQDLDGNALADTTPTGTNDNHFVVNDPDAPAAEPAASFASASSNPAEDAGTHKVMVNLAPAPSGGLTLSYTVDGTATAGSGQDFTIQSAGTLSVAAGATSAAVPVGIHDDVSVEGDETVVLTLTDGTGYTLGDTTAHTFTIADNDASAGTPGVTVSTGALDLVEGGTAGSYTVVLASQPTADVTVTATSGDAAKVRLHKQGGSPGASTTLTFTPTTWNQAQTITVTPEQDSDADDESVTVAHAVSQTGGYTGVTAASVTVAVDDDEAPAACVSADLRADVDSHVQETWRAHPHVERWNRVLAAFGAANGHSSMTATEAQTYADRGLPRWVPVVTALECLEGAPPPPALPAIRIADGTGITEGGDAVFTVSASPAPTASLTVSLTVADDGASDFLAPADEGAQTVTFAGGQSSATLTLTTEDDSTDETDGSVSATVADGTGYTIGTPATGTVAVSDNDPTPSTTPVISIAGGAGVTEGGDAVFTVSASPAPTASLTVSLTVADDGTSDFLAPADEGTQTVTIAGGQSSATLTLTTEDDSTDETNGSVSATVADGTGYTVGTPATGTVAVSDNDPSPPPPALPVIGIAGGSAITEGGTANFTLTATPAPLGTLTVKVNVVDSGAFAASGGAGARTVTIGTTGSATLAVATDNDSTDEPDGTLSATIASGQGYTPSGTHGSASIAVSDDDAATTCVSGTLLADVQGYAGETWRTSPGHVERWNRVLAAFGVSNGHSSMTATEAQTYADRGLPRWVPVLTALECLAGTPPPPALPAISVADGTGITEGGDAVFTVNASPAPTSSLTVSLTVADDGTSNFLAQSDEGTQTVTIAGGQSSATLTLTTEDDSTDEADGSVSATVAGGTGYTVGSPSTGTVAVSDNDPTPSTTPVISIADGTGITEGGDAVFTVSASPAPAANLTVSLTVADDGTSDFLAPSDEGTRTVTIAGGQSSATLTLTTEDDSTDEADGSVSATVAGGSGYTVGSPSTGTVAVSDNDPTPPTTPVISIAAGGDVSEGAAAEFTLTASPVPAASITVDVALTQGGDFASSGQTGTRAVTIASSGTATVTVATDDDSTDEPDGSVTATVQTGTGYSVAAAPGNAATVAVADNDGTTSGPTLSIADASFTENERYGYFTVTLSEAMDVDVRFAYATRDSTPVSATANADYAPVSRAWKIGRRVKAGQTQIRFWIPIRNDSHDEGPETFEVEIFDAFVWRAGKVPVAISDAVAVGTITNSDPMPAAWLARFGRTVAEAALEGVAERIAAPRERSVEGTLAGQKLTLDGSAAGDRTVAPGSADSVPVAHADAPFAAGAAGESEARILTLGEALRGSSFTATGARDASGGSVALWGRAANTTFDGREGTFSLDGKTTTAMLGADYARDDWLLGLLITQSEGDGKYRDTGTTPRAEGQDCPGTDARLCAGAVREGDGGVEASLTAAVPYAALQASERVQIWGAVGYGRGEVRLQPQAGHTLHSDITWTMGSAGLTGDLLGGPDKGLSLALVSDALWARTRSDATGELAASDSDTTRLRLGLKGRWAQPLAGGGYFTPKLEAGMRHDGGDAETGFGVELGGGLAWSAPALGLNLDLSGRTLLAHGDDDFRNRGFAAAFAFDPDPASERGPSLSLGQSYGGPARGGLDALFTPGPLADRAGNERQRRWTAETAWGFPAFGGRFTGSPHAGVGLTRDGSDTTLGFRVVPARDARGLDLSFGVVARRSEGLGATNHSVGVEFGVRW